MRVVTTGIVLLCGLLILVGGFRLLARETAFVETLIGFMRQAGSDGGGTTADTTDAVSTLGTPDEAIFAELAELLKRELRAHPTGSLFWLWLAQTRRSQSPERFNAALQLSALTAPREAAIVLERAIVGLQFWDALNPQLRRATMADLVTILPRLNRQPLERVKAAISTQDFSSQQEIAVALGAQDYAGRYLKRLGVSNAYTQ